MTARELPVTYELMIAKAASDAGYRDGLLDAAQVARAQGGTPEWRAVNMACPPEIVAVYIEAIANGEMP